MREPNLPDRMVRRIGSCVPSDWDGGPVLWSSGRIGQPGGPGAWRTDDAPCSYIFAYRPKPGYDPANHTPEVVAPPTPTLAELVDRLVGLKTTCDEAMKNSQGLADHKLIILANYGDLALQLAPAIRAALDKETISGS